MSKTILSQTIAALVILSALLACKDAGPAAVDVCAKLVATGVAANCKTDAPGGIGAAAKERVVFDLPSVPGQTGQVLRFEKADFYDSTEKAFAGAAALAGRHQYGSRKALIFVQLNSDASDETGAKAKAVVDAL
jgi:hypothetical protein